MAKTYKCEGCGDETPADEYNKVYNACGQETICSGCAQYYAYSQSEGLWYHFDDSGKELSYSEWTEESRAKADKYADVLGHGWPVICV